MKTLKQSLPILIITLLLSNCCKNPRYITPGMLNKNFSINSISYFIEESEGQPLFKNSEEARIKEDSTLTINGSLIHIHIPHPIRVNNPYHFSEVWQNGTPMPATAYAEWFYDSTRIYRTTPNSGYVKILKYNNDTIEGYFECYLQNNSYEKIRIYKGYFLTSH